MSGFDALHLQCVAQGVRHGLRIAKIAHESTSSSANGRDRGLPCRPVRQWRGAERFDTFTIPEGRRRRVYRPNEYFAAVPGSMSISNTLQSGGAGFETLGLVAGLDDVAALGDPVEQRGGHLGVAEH